MRTVEGGLVQTVACRPPLTDGIVPGWPPQAPNQLFAFHSTLTTTRGIVSLHWLSILALMLSSSSRRGSDPCSPASPNSHLCYRLTVSDEERPKRAHHQLSSTNTQSRWRIQALTDLWYRSKSKKSLWYHESVSDPHCATVWKLNSSLIPSVRLGHTIAAWVDVSSKCTGQNKRAAHPARGGSGSWRRPAPVCT